MRVKEGNRAACQPDDRVHTRPDKGMPEVIDRQRCRANTVAEPSEGLIESSLDLELFWTELLVFGVHLGSINHSEPTQTKSKRYVG